MTPLTPESATLLRESMARFRAEMVADNEFSIKISRKTGQIMVTVAGILVITWFFLVFMIVSMSKDLASMIDNLDTMYLQFGRMAEDMQVIAGHVGNMGNNVSTMPAVSKNLYRINGDMADVVTSLQGMRQHMNDINLSVSGMGYNISEMSYRFGNVQRSVDMMNYNVGQMMHPLTLFPH